MTFASLGAPCGLDAEVRAIGGMAARAVNHFVTGAANDAHEFFAEDVRSGAIRAINAAAAVNPKDRVGEIVQGQFQAGVFFRQLHDQFGGNF
jgi:hypothetical protein